MSCIFQMQRKRAVTLALIKERKNCDWQNFVSIKTPGAGIRCGQKTIKLHCHGQNWKITLKCANKRERNLSLCQ